MVEEHEDREGWRFCADLLTLPLGIEYTELDV